jgi:small subunit ribosomal protein S16
MLSIRLRRTGSTKRPSYRVVVTEARSTLVGSFVENLGTYNPRSTPAQVDINTERLQHWLAQGARPSDTVRTLVKNHLSRDLAALATADSEATGTE